MATFVLVHGAFHGAWCWERLVPELESRGHRAVAIDLPGMGADPCPPESGTLAGYAARVADTIRGLEQKPFVVGHSLGGATISEAGELCSDAIAGLIYLSAVLLPPGVAIAAMAEKSLFVAPDPPMRMLPADGHDGCLVVAEEDIVPFMYHRTDSEGQARAVRSCGPQPNEPMTVPLSVTEQRWGRLPRAFIECLDDRIVTLESQRLVQRHLPCDPVIAIDSDHSPFYSATDELADALCSVAEAWGG